MRIGVRAVNPYLSDPVWLANAKQNLDWAASKGCVFDYINNVECCVGSPEWAKHVLSQDQSVIADAVANCGKTRDAAIAQNPPPSVKATQINRLSTAYPQPLIPRITPQNLTRPLPDITQALRPLRPACSSWSQLNGWISDHPVIATAMLVGTALFVMGGQRGR